MKLIRYENYEVTISDEALLVKPIRKLFNSDRTKNKEKFMQQMSILFFLKDPRSSYNYIIDEEERYRQILLQEGLPEDTRISKDLQDAIDIYVKLVDTPSARLLKSTIIGAEKLGKFIESVDYSAVDKNGKPIWQPAAIAGAIDKVPKMVKTLQDTQKRVDQEIDEAGRARGGNESKKMFEDGIDYEDDDDN